MIQIGSGSYVRRADITQVIALTDMRDMSEIKNAYANGKVLVIAGRNHCTAIYLADGRIFFLQLPLRQSVVACKRLIGQTFLINAMMRILRPEGGESLWNSFA